MIRRHVTRTAGKRRDGQTLLELLVALPLMTAIISAAGGLIFIASQTRTLTEGLLADKIESSRVALEVTGNLQHAISIAELSAHAVEFSTTDRDGDGVEDSYRYEWSGTVGDPLYRVINGGERFVIAENVNQFLLTSTSEISNSAGAYEALKTVVKHHDDSTGGTFSTTSVSGNLVTGQYFQPELDGSTTTWSLDRFRFMARSSGVRDGQVKMEVYIADAFGRPDGDPLEEVVIAEVDLDEEFTWTDVDFWDVTDLNSSQALCVLFTRTSGTDAALEVQLESDGDNMTPSTHWLQSLNAGLSWRSSDDATDLRFYAIGRHDGSTSSQRRSLSDFTVNLQVGDDDQVAVEATANFWNSPEDTGG